MKRELALRALCGGVMALASSCTSKHGTPAKPQTEVGVASSASAPSGATAALRVPASRVAASASANCSASRPETLSEAVLAELVARWRRAQSSADFLAYSSLYGEHFVGLLRRGASTARVDRRAWLGAHQASLALDPALARAALHIVIARGGAQIVFGARSAHAADARLPELFVAASTNGAKIVREAPARTTPTELSNQPGLWLADERYAVLSTTPDADWAEGEPTPSGDDTATRSVDLSRLPKSLRGWLGRPVRVLGEGGTVCETRLQRFAMRAKISPDLPRAEAWQGCAEDRPSRDAIANDIWRLSAVEGRSLVAEFSTPCKGALLAVDPDREAPPIAAPEPASAELGAAALAAFRGLPDYIRIQARFKAESPETEGAWEDREARRSVWSLDLPGHAPLLFVSVEAGSGCASFSASLSALWEVHHTGGVTPSLTLLAVPSAEDERRLTPRAALDLDHTGGTSLLLGPDGAYAARALLSKSSGGYRQTLLASAPFFAGPC